MVEHPGGDGAVERRRRANGSSCTSPTTRVDARARARARPSARDWSTATTSRAELARDPLGELARPAADLEHASGLDLGDRLERRRSRAVGPVGVARRRDAARREARLASRTRAATSVRVVEPHGVEDRRARDAAARRLAAEPGVDGRADVGELALVHPPGRVLARGVGEQQRVLARVVGRRRRRVAAVVGGEDQQVAGPQRLEEVAAAGGRSPAGSGGS